MILIRNHLSSLIISFQEKQWIIFLSIRLSFEQWSHLNWRMKIKCFINLNFFILFFVHNSLQESLYHDEWWPTTIVMNFSYLNKVKKFGRFCNWVGNGGTGVTKKYQFLWISMDHIKKSFHSNRWITLYIHDRNWKKGFH